MIRNCLAQMAVGGAVIAAGLFVGTRILFFGVRSLSSKYGNGHLSRCAVGVQARAAVFGGPLVVSGAAASTLLMLVYKA